MHRFIKPRGSLRQPCRGFHQRVTLMKRSTKYVSLNVRQATTVVTVCDPIGRVIARGMVPTEEEALLEFIAAKRGSILIASE
jgi:hypothetical protein